MSLLTYLELIKLVENGSITGVEPEHINAASIDVIMGPTVMVESSGGSDFGKPVDLSCKKNIRLFELDLTPPNDALYLMPGQFALLHTSNKFYLPNDVAAQFVLKSSLARNGLDHLLAGWCDPGWHNSVLTLEVRNVTQFHTLVLRPGMKIGQMTFWRGREVPAAASYATRGQYNGDDKVSASKGVR